MAQIFEASASDNVPKMKRMGYAPTPCPTTRPLEDIYYPSGRTIAEAAHELISGSPDWTAPHIEAEEIAEFRGPF